MLKISPKNAFGVLVLVFLFFSEKIGRFSYFRKMTEISEIHNKFVPARQNKKFSKTKFDCGSGGMLGFF